MWLQYAAAGVLVLVVGALLVWVFSPYTFSSNKAVATAHLRIYCAVQSMYRRKDWDGDGVFEYAFPYTLLNTQRLPKSGPIKLIDDAFANASRDNPLSGTTVPNHGYLFVDLVGDAKVKSYDDGKGNCVHGYGLCAYPAEYGRTGRMTFVTTIEGTVYMKDTEGKPVTVFPDVEKEGWAACGR